VANDLILTSMSPLVSPEHNQILLRTISFEEVRAMVNSMETSKSLGPDGFMVEFFQNHWSIIREDVWRVVEESRIFSKILHDFYSYFITLILKEPNPEIVYKFRPISICNAIYKIISKIIANKLKPIMHKIISQE